VRRYSVTLGSVVRVPRCGDCCKYECSQECEIDILDLLFGSLTVGVESKSLDQVLTDVVRFA
jgi:hypothetical protein